MRRICTVTEMKKSKVSFEFFKLDGSDHEGNADANKKLSCHIIISDYERTEAYVLRGVGFTADVIPLAETQLLTSKPSCSSSKGRP